MSFSKIILIGNLGNDPELRYTPQETPVCDFTMATNENVGGKDFTTWFKVTVWRAQAEAVANNLKKGSQVYVEGSINVEQWQDKDGNVRHTIKVTASTVKFLGSRQSQTSSPSTQDTSSEEETSTAKPSEPKRSTEKKSADDIPF